MERKEESTKWGSNIRAKRFKAYLRQNGVTFKKKTDMKDLLGAIKRF